MTTRETQEPFASAITAMQAHIEELEAEVDKADLALGRAVRENPDADHTQRRLDAEHAHAIRDGAAGMLTIALGYRSGIYVPK